jgi:MFS family permease
MTSFAASFRAPLESRDFRLLFAGRTIQRAGSAMTPIAYAFAVIELGGSATSLGIVVAAGLLPTVMFLLVGGVVADRLPRHLVMVASNILNFSIQSVAAVLLLTGSATITHLVVLSLGSGTVAAFFFPAAAAVVPQTVPREHLQPANALQNLGLNAGTIGGAAIGGVVVDVVGPGWAVAADAASFLMAAALIVRLSARGGTRSTDSEAFLDELRHGWTEFRRHRWLWVVVAGFSVALATGHAAFYVLGPIVADESLDAAHGWGLVLGAEGVGLIVGGLIALRARFGRPLLAGCLCATVLILRPLVLGLRLPLALTMVGTFVAGVGIEIFGVNWFLSVQGHVPEEMLSRVFAWDALGSIGLLPLGLVVVGPVSEAIGTNTTLFACSGIVAVAMLAQLLVRDVRELPRPANT